MIEMVNHQNFSAVLPLILEYQTFYGVKDLDSEKNKKFFSQFLQPNDRGILHLLRKDNTAVGFSTIYFCFSSTLAQPVAVLNDLYVSSKYRSRGYGETLLSNATQYANSHGYARLQWVTAIDNKPAQSLYDRADIHKSQWYLYTHAG